MWNILVMLLFMQVDCKELGWVLMFWSCYSMQAFNAASSPVIANLPIKQLVKPGEAETDVSGDVGV